ncbi:urease accessory protein UreD [Pseudanabaena sp. FACHB-2040]|uniref:urease accessory protein UreD n=1 Tax=Pseudanabaena sp. FACHB-2040 TaxID=2692859 RepID=UPI0016863790|nr:urease accessory protein UreD [Pseudanabaena sp. FACHB-2040]MBD2257578.1 urease accessory protein UreD [Pseudanabaena sp. FACHB-2040]
MASNPATLPSDSAQFWRGSARLVYAHDQGKTVLAQNYAQAPLKLQKPLYPEGDSVCHSVLVHTAGGMVGSDRIHIEADLAPTSRALVTSAAANKIYRSQGQTAQQVTQLALSENTCLEWLPQETIVFNGAHFYQQTRVDLTAGSIWLGWDITRFGRSARGETFQQGHWRSHLEIWQAGRPLWLDRQFLAGGSETLTNLHGLAGHPVLASLVLVGYTPTSDDLEKLRALKRPNAPAEVGITRLQQGLLCRYRGPSSQMARQWFVALWSCLRPVYLGRPACVSRIWGV